MKSLWPMIMLLAAAALGIAAEADGAIGFRLNNVPADSAAARAGLRVGDVLTAPGQVAPTLNAAGPTGAKIPYARFDPSAGRYTTAEATVVHRDGEPRRLGVVGDLGFLFDSVQKGSSTDRAGVKAGDFVGKINDTFVHAPHDLAALEKVDQTELIIQAFRWDPGANNTIALQWTVAVDPFLGSWELDVTKSKLPATNPPVRMIVKWVMAGGALEVQVNGATAARDFNYSYRPIYDGKPHPPTGSWNWEAVRNTQIDRHTRDDLYFKGNKRIGVERRIVSPDGKSLTYETSFDGEEPVRLVFRRIG